MGFARSGVGFEVAEELFAGVVQTRVDGALCETEDLGDLGRGQTVGVTEDDR